MNATVVQLRSIAFAALLVGVCSAGCSQEQTQTAAVASIAYEPSEPRTQGEDWPTFLGPRGDGTSSETGIDPSRWAPHPPIAWTLDLGISYGGPTVSQGRLFQFDRFGEYERLTCFDAANGREIWRWESKVAYEDSLGYNNGPRCCPILDGDRVYTYGVAGQLSCVDFETGKVLWSKNLASEYLVVQNFFGVASAPCIHEDLLLVMVGGSTPASQNLTTGRLNEVEPNGSAVVAFNKLTGEEVYRVGNDLASYSSLVVKQVEGKPMGLAFLRSGLMAWEPATGKEIFKYPWRASMFESVNAAVPVTFENQIFVSEAYEIGSSLLNIRGDKPNIVWKDQGQLRSLSFRAHWSTPVLIDGYLYGCCGRNSPDSDFRCVRWSDGAVQWAEVQRDTRRSSVLHVDGYLIVVGETGVLQLVRPNPQKLDVVAQVDMSSITDPKDGRPLLEDPCWAAPVLSRGLLYVRGYDRLVCFDLIPEK